MSSPWYHESMHGFTGVAFVGCVHTVTPELQARMDRLLEYVDAFENFALVFGGDLSSSKLLDDMKRHFYDAKRSVPGSLKSLIDLVYANGGLNEETGILGGWLKTVQNEEYIGPWIGKYGSDALRKAIEQGFIDNTDAICEMAKKFRDRGARVLVCGGNWDDVHCTRDTLKIPDVPDHLPKLRDMGVEVFTEIGHTRVGNVDLVFLPYWELDKQENAETLCRLDSAIDGCNGATVIAVAHAEPNWAVHNNMNPVISPKRAKIIANLDYCLAVLGPDQVVYPHQHDPIKSADGHALGNNVKYLLELQQTSIGGSPTVTLVEDPQAVKKPADEIIVASFIPFQKVALLTTQDDDDQRPEIFGGNGKLIEVLSM